MNDTRVSPGTRLRVGVLFGGRSGEHEVSLVSAASIMRALDPARYDVIPVGITKDGRWFRGDGVLEWLHAEASGEHGAEPRVARPGGVHACVIPPDPSLGPMLVETGDGRWEREALDVVFPVLHGTFGEDGTVQGVLELAGLPYVGAGVLGSAVGMDKVVHKLLFREAGLPVTPFEVETAERCRNDVEEVARWMEERLGYPVFVKPPNMGSSVGISKARTREELRDALLLAASYDRTVLVEAAVPEAREIEVAVLGDTPPVASVPGEVIPSNEFYDYDAKYVDGASRTVAPAELPAETSAQVRALALRAFETARCEGMARVDFLLSRASGALVLNEINTIPGFTSISMYPRLLEASGIPYPELLDRLIAAALRRSDELLVLRRDYIPTRAWHLPASE